ncbi:MAG: hypothetical protein K8T20_09075 [Planctomycetes bacterium]|nr:hypothetical protein [Planctomycetota bacterium]
MKRILALPALLLALSAAIPAHAGLLDPKGKSFDDFTIELEGRYWFGALKGDLSADTGDVTGTGIDFPGNLGLNSPSQPMIEGVARLKVSKFMIRASYFQASFSKSTRLDETITFQGVDYTVGTDIKSRATIRVGALDIMALLLDAGHADKIGLRVGIGIGGRYLGFYGSIRETFSGQAESASGTGIIPVISATASLGFLNIFSINLDVAGMKVPKNQYLQVRGTFIDAAAEIRIYLAKFVYVAGGYRFLMLKALYHDGDVELDSRLTGFYVGAGISF